jgi:serine/threonine protein kinase
MSETSRPGYGLGLPNIQLGEVIGGGGFARVYRAYDSLLRRDLAVKILRPVTGVEMRRAFENEAGIHGPLSRHPNIVTIHHAGFTAGGDLTVGGERPYLVMDLVSGGTLADHLRERGPIAWQHAAAWMVPLCDAVSHVHASGVLHRDIKPDNILLDPPNTPLLSDLGIACLEDETNPLHAMSFPHVAPEALRGERRGFASDVYSIASTLYELLSGTAPFGTTLEARLANIDAGPNPLPALPPWLDQLLRSAMAPDPAHRLPTAGVLRQQLQAGLGTAPVELPTVVVRAPVPRPGIDSRPPHPSVVPDPTAGGSPSATPATVVYSAEPTASTGRWAVPEAQPVGPAGRRRSAALLAGTAIVLAVAALAALGLWWAGLLSGSAGDEPLAAGVDGSSTTLDPASTSTPDAPAGESGDPITDTSEDEPPSQQPEPEEEEPSGQGSGQEPGSGEGQGTNDDSDDEGQGSEEPQEPPPPAAEPAPPGDCCQVVGGDRDVLVVPVGGEVALAGTDLWRAPVGAPEPSCASGSISFTWQVQDPYPSTGLDWELATPIPFNPDLLEAIGTGDAGESSIGYCSALVLRNFDTTDLVVELRWSSVVAT